MKCAINDTIAYVKLLAQNLAGCDSNCAILAIMFDLAIPVNYDGFVSLEWNPEWCEELDDMIYLMLD